MGTLITMGNDVKEKVVLESPSGERYELNIQLRMNLPSGTAYNFLFADNKPLDYFNMDYKVYVDNVCYPIKRIERIIVELIDWKDAGGPVGFLI